MAAADSDYRFIKVDIGAYESEGDANVLLELHPTKSNQFTIGFDQRNTICFCGR